MNSRKIILPAFIIVALIQLYIPAKMVLDQEDILTSGTIYKFRAAPIDPIDPFRGKYITLTYRETTFDIPNEKDWVNGETIYVSFATDNDGFAKIRSVSKDKPTGTNDFLKARVSYISINGENELTIEYPFNRFYMEESKAYDAELTYRQSQLDTNQVTYSLVSIKKGDAVLRDVLIDGRSIKEIAKANQQNKK